jgi:hypothetical protein
MLSDPMERMIAEALDAAGVAYTHERERGGGLDFHLPDNGVWIEVKQFHSDRIAAQMATQPNVIVAQGRVAVQALAAMIRAGGLAPLSPVVEK